MQYRQRDADDLAALAVFRRVRRDGHPLTMTLVRETVADLGGAAKADRVYFQVQVWTNEIAATQRRA